MRLNLHQHIVSVGSLGTPAGSAQISKKEESGVEERALKKDIFSNLIPL